LWEYYLKTGFTSIHDVINASGMDSLHVYLNNGGQNEIHLKSMMGIINTKWNYHKNHYGIVVYRMRLTLNP